MRILKIRLQNVKSYGEEAPEIEFASGVNFLSGLNGAGKSTIIESLGYALFGVLNTRQEDFRRRGAKTGTVTVWIEDGGETFRIVRKFGARDAWVVFDKDEVSIEKREDVLRFLCDRLRVRSPKQLENVFSYMIGVPQGMFTAVFKMTGADRKKIFDGIIDVNAYRDASDARLAVKTRIVETEITVLKEKIAAARAYVGEHKDDPMRLAEAVEQIKAINWPCTFGGTRRPVRPTGRPFRIES